GDARPCSRPHASLRRALARRSGSRRQCLRRSKPRIEVGTVLRNGGRISGEHTRLVCNASPARTFRRPRRKRATKQQCFTWSSSDSKKAPLRKFIGASAKKVG